MRRTVRNLLLRKQAVYRTVQSLYARGPDSSGQRRTGGVKIC